MVEPKVFIIIIIIITCARFKILGPGEARRFMKI
jgi:hypothetical protein